MKPAAFDYIRAKDADDAVALLTQSGGDSRLIAGGQSLGPMLNLRLTRPGLLIDVSRAADLRACTEDSDMLRIGAAVTHADIEDGRTPAGADGFLAKAARGIAYRAVRNRGTIGGSLAHADPAADWPLVLSALGATIAVIGPGGRRQIVIDQFIKGAFATALQDGEVIAAILVPRAALTASWGYWKLCRKAGEFPIASAAVVGSGRSWRVFIGALADRPRPLTDLVAALGAGERIDTRPAALMPFIVKAVPEMDPIDLRMYAGCLSRALAQATPP